MPDDPLDAGNIHRRLGVLAAALDDLPRHGTLAGTAGCAG
jgi:hypothetical protein